MLSAFPPITADPVKITEVIGAFASASSAAFSLAAGVIAALALRRAGKVLAIQHRQIAYLEEDRLAAAASKFAIWIERSPHDPNNEQSVVKYHNLSPLPMYDVRVAFLMARKTSDFKVFEVNVNIGVVAPTSSPAVHEQLTQALREAYQDNVKLPAVAFTTSREVSAAALRKAHNSSMQPRVTFREGTRQWRRMHNGELVVFTQQEEDEESYRTLSQ